MAEQLQLQIFERSSFRNEAGAAISLTPNGARILESWGFDQEKARGIQNIQVSRVGKENCTSRQAFPFWWYSYSCL